MVDAHSRSTIAKKTYDPDHEAVRIREVAGVASSTDGWGTGKTLVGSSSAVEIGSMAGSREKGIIVVSRAAVNIHINIGTDADTDDGYLEDGEGVRLPTNGSVYAIAASGSDHEVVYWEL